MEEVIQRPETATVGHPSSPGPMKRQGFLQDVVLCSGPLGVEWGGCSPLPLPQKLALVSAL